MPSTKNPFFPSVLLFPSSFLFLFIDIIIAPRETRPLYNSLDRQIQGNSLLFTILSILVSPWLTVCFFSVHSHWRFCSHCTAKHHYSFA
jgi:hypothetical protein